MLELCIEVVMEMFLMFVFESLVEEWDNMGLFVGD